MLDSVIQLWESALCDITNDPNFSPRREFALRSAMGRNNHPALMSFYLPFNPFKKHAIKN